MDTANPAFGPGFKGETATERQRRSAYEAFALAEARAELDDGLYVDAAEIGVWIASIGTDHELPPPPTRRY